METIAKLKILADAAKYDASCASSGSDRRSSEGGQGIGSTEGMGICHAYAPDGRCISLLKILLTNFCMYECSYCVNRNSSNTPRARFSVAEVVDLTLSFYRRNYIEGLFLSSGVIRSPDYTMEQLVAVARSLREDHDFRGYIHLKTIPDADGQLLTDAGRYADRLSINFELPSTTALAQLAPQKDHRTIKLSMARIRTRREAAKEAQRSVSKTSTAKVAKRKVAAPRFAPAGQSTQMVIGAEPSTDASILTTSASLYAGYGLSRVYYSAFSPIPDASSQLPAQRAPLLREHRLYQSDWLLRFYGFSVDEITPQGSAGEDDPAQAGMLDLDIDPKLAWALRHRDWFPVDLNRGSREQLLRVPGLGARTVQRLLKMRRLRRIRLADLSSLRAAANRARPFVICADYHPSGAERASERLRARFRAPPEQLQMTL